MTIKELINESIHTKSQLLEEPHLKTLEKIGKILIEALKKEGKILVAGNGGSAADAQHFAGELVGKFLSKRQALPAIALTTDPSVITAISNDFGFASVFARQIEALGKAGDIFLAISTSGNSPNLVQAAQKAKAKGLMVVGILGKDGGELKTSCEISIIVRSDNSQRIQEGHTLIIHILAELIDQAYAKQD